MQCSGTRRKRAWSRRLLLAALLVAFLAAGAAGLTLTAEDRSAPPGGTVAVPIVIGGAQDLGEAEMLLDYDPAVVRFDSASPGSLADRARIEAVENVPGRITLSLAAPRSLTGSGPVAELTFGAVGQSGARSSLNIEVVRAVTVDGEAVPVQVRNGSVRVGGGPRTPLSPLAVACALVVVAAAFGATRRRRP